MVQATGTNLSSQIQICKKSNFSFYNSTQCLWWVSILPTGSLMLGMSAHWEVPDMGHWRQLWSGLRPDLVTTVGSQESWTRLLGPPSLAPPCGHHSLGPHTCLPRWTARRQGRAPDTSDLSPLCLLPTSGLQRVRLQRVGVLPPRWNHSSILFPVKVFILRKRILFLPWASLHILKFP